MTESNHNMPTATGNANSIDEPYTWGRPPSIYLAPRQVARLLILRSKVRANITPEAAAGAAVQQLQPESHQHDRV